MLNVTVVGNCYDQSGFRLDCEYYTEYKERGIVGATKSTSQKQFNFNLGDADELGYGSSIPTGRGRVSKDGLKTRA